MRCRSCRAQGPHSCRKFQTPRDRLNRYLTPRSLAYFTFMSFDSVSALHHECCCGRTFLQTNAYSNHQKSCKKTKTRLSSALSSARDNWQRRKKARITEPNSQQPEVNSSALSYLPWLSNDHEPGITNPATTASNTVEDIPLPTPLAHHSEAVIPSHEVNIYFILH